MVSLLGTFSHTIRMEQCQYCSISLDFSRTEKTTSLNKKHSPCPCIQLVIFFFCSRSISLRQDELSFASYEVLIGCGRNNYSFKKYTVYDFIRELDFEELGKSNNIQDGFRGTWIRANFSTCVTSLSCLAAPLVRLHPWCALCRESLLPGIRCSAGQISGGNPRYSGSGSWRPPWKGCRLRVEIWYEGPVQDMNVINYKKWDFGF